MDLFKFEVEELAHDDAQKLDGGFSFGWDAGTSIRALTISIMNGGGIAGAYAAGLDYAIHHAGHNHG